MEEQQKEKTSEEIEKGISLEKFLRDMEEGLKELIQDEVLREKTAAWVKVRIAELALVVIQQSKAIENLASTLDSVLSNLRQWAWSSDKGWFRARAILNFTLDRFKRRMPHGSGKKEEPTGPSSKSEGKEARSPASGIDGGGEAGVKVL